MQDKENWCNRISWGKRIAARNNKLLLIFCGNLSEELETLDSTNRIVQNYVGGSKCIVFHVSTAWRCLDDPINFMKAEKKKN